MSYPVPRPAVLGVVALLVEMKGSMNALTRRAGQTSERRPERTISDRGSMFERARLRSDEKTDRDAVKA
jgi:hypothetical protein